MEQASLNSALYQHIQARILTVIPTFLGKQFVTIPPPLWRMDAACSANILAVSMPTLNQLHTIFTATRHMERIAFALTAL